MSDAYSKAILDLFNTDLSHEISRGSLVALLTHAGIGKRLAGGLADDALLYLKLQPAGLAMNDVRVALTTSIASLASILPALWFTELLEAHPELRQPPTEEPPTNLPDVGIVHRGRTTVRTGDVPRDYFWIWLQRHPNAACPDFRWYQFARPRLLVNGVDVGADDTIPVATGLDVAFGEWNPDYHKDPAKLEERERRRDGLPKIPDFTPDLPPDAPGDDPPKVKPGKPHIETPVPGAHDVTGVTSTGPRARGVLDSPNFNERPEANKPSSIEKLWFDNSRSRGTGDQPPPPLEGVDDVEVRVELRTYLVCIEGEQARCIGWVSWTSSSHARIHWGWERAREAVPDLGISAANPHWKRFVRRTEFRLVQTFGDWTAC